MKKKLTLDFEPDEEDEFKIVARAMDYYLTLIDIKDHIRSILKYTDVSEEVEKQLETIRDLVHGRIDVE